MRLFSRIAAATVVLIGGVVLTGGWLLGIEALRSLPLGSVSMKLNSALGLAAAGSALWLLQEGAGRRRRRAGWVCATLLSLIGILTLAEYGSGRSLGIDELLFTDLGSGAGPTPGRPALNTAIAFILLGMSFFALDRETPRGWHLADGFAVGAGLISLLGLLGFVAGDPALIVSMPITVMAPITSGAILLLAAGLLAARQQLGLIRDLSSAEEDNGAARRPVLVGFIFALGLLGGVTWMEWRSSARMLATLSWVAGTHEVQGQQIPTEITRMERREQILLAQRSAAAAHEAGTSRLLAVGGTGVSFALLIAAVAILLRENRMRQRANLAVRESEERFRATFEQGSVGMAHVGLDGHLLVANQRLCEMLGYSSEELSLSFRAITHTEDSDLDLSISKVRQMLEGELSHYSTRKRYSRKDGSPLWISLTVGMVRKPSGEPHYFVSVWLDITDRVQAEKAIRYQSEFHRVAGEISTALIDAPAGGLDEAINAALRKIGALFGIDRSYMFLFSHERETMTNTHEWCAPGIEPLIHETQHFPSAQMSHALGKFRIGESFHVPDVDALPAEAAAELRELKRKGVQSLMWLPMARNKKLLGFLGFDAVTRKRTWTESETSLLQVLVNTIAGALLRDQAEAALREASTALEQRVVERTAALEAANGRLLLSEFSVERASVAVLWVGKDARILRVNQRACEESGYAEGELLGMTVHDLNPRFPVDGWPAHWQQLRQQRHLRFDAILRRKDGHVVPVEVDTNWFEFEGKELDLVFLRDITERRQAADAILREKAFSEALLESLPGIFFLFDHTGRFLRWNRALVSVSGYSAEEVATMQPLDFFEEEDRTSIGETIGKVFETGAAEAAATVLAKDGSKIPFYFVGVRIEVNGVPCFLGTGIDFTVRRQLEMQLRQAQKIEAIGQLAGGIAHDFNNILSVIMIFGELALRQLEPGHPVQARVDKMMKAAEQAAGLTRQLLAFSRKQVIKPRLLDLNDIVAGTHKMLGRLIGEDIQVIVRPSPGLGTVKADAGQIEQIIMNFAVNARDAMPKGGSLTLETANVNLGEEYAATHFDTKAGRYVLLAMSDTGIGMDEATQARIFEPFFTTKPEGQGTGLGLSTVYGIVKQSGGGIQVYSEPGRGATFKVYLPRVDEPGETAPPDVPQPIAPRGQETILLVEDNQTLREVIRDTLKGSGYTVLTALNGEEGLAQAREHKGPIDLLLTDVVMPKLGGGDLAKALSGLRPGIRVLFMSGYTDGAIAQQGVLTEGAALLEKPFTAEKLVRAVRETLAQRIENT